MQRVLIVDDDEDILTAGKLLLKRHYQVVTCSDPTVVPRLMSTQSFAAILLDMNFGPGESSGKQGFIWLEKILELNPEAVVILITAHGGVDVAVEAIKQGATDFVAKPWQNEKLLATVSSGVKLWESRNEVAALRQANSALTDSIAPPAMLGSSSAMASVERLIERAAATDANVLILGENGTGKELAARALHTQSDRAANVFVSVDLGAVPETLFESELFGHRKGAFTDARSDRIGRLQAANGGTVFLDEVGNLPLHLQAKLLTVLEKRQVTPVGCDEPVDIDVRVVAATNMPLDQLNDEHLFRQDLLFRLNTVELHLPPLRKRRDDVEEIARHYAAVYTRKYGRPEKDFDNDSLDALRNYDWPGNIRALKHAVERAVILSDGDQLTPQDFALEAVLPQRTETQEEADDLNLERIEKQTIEQALRRHGYNISHSAKELGLTRAALYRRMEKHGL